MSNKLSSLRDEGKISDEEYNTYLLFVANDIGALYLKKKLYSVVMEEVTTPTKQCFTWKDGRHSTWRDISMMICRVEALLKGETRA